VHKPEKKITVAQTLQAFRPPGGRAKLRVQPMQQSIFDPHIIYDVVRSSAQHSAVPPVSAAH
jgi:hypothetical protein